MEILARESDWTQIDEERLAAFLDSETGKRLLPKLAGLLPELLPGGEINAILIRSGEVRASQKMIENLFLLAHPPLSPAKEQTNEYPSLTDDKSWNDGQKLTQEDASKQQQKTS